MTDVVIGKNPEEVRDYVYRNSLNSPNTIINDRLDYTQLMSINEDYIVIHNIDIMRKFQIKNFIPIMGRNAKKDNRQTRKLGVIRASDN